MTALTRPPRPGGRLAVTVPTRWPERVSWALNYHYHDTPGGHVRIFRQHELEGKLERAGLYLRGSHHAHALLVRGDAVSFDQQGEYVLVVNDKNVVERRSVKTGQQFGDQLAIVDGLKANDRVVVDGILQAIPGRAVTPQPAGAAAP